MTKRSLSVTLGLLVVLFSQPVAVSAYAQNSRNQFFVKAAHIKCVAQYKERYLDQEGEKLSIILPRCPRTSARGFSEVPEFRTPRTNPDLKYRQVMILQRNQFECVLKQIDGQNGNYIKIDLSECSN